MVLVDILIDPGNHGHIRVAIFLSAGSKTETQDEDLPFGVHHNRLFTRDGDVEVAKSSDSLCTCGLVYGIRESGGSSVGGDHSDHSATSLKMWRDDIGRVKTVHGGNLFYQMTTEAKAVKFVTSISREYSNWFGGDD